MHRLLLSWFALLLAACTAPQRFQGHWTRVDETSGVFQLANGKQYFLNQHGLPRAVTSFVEAQPLRRDGRIDSGASKSAYFEVSAFVDNSPPDCLFAFSPDRLDRLDIFWVRKMEPARPDFLKALATAKKRARKSSGG